MNQGLGDVSERQKADGFGLKMKEQPGTSVKGLHHEEESSSGAEGSSGDMTVQVIGVP